MVGAGASCSFANVPERKQVASRNASVYKHIGSSSLDSSIILNLVRDCPSPHDKNARICAEKLLEWITESENLSSAQLYSS